MSDLSPQEISHWKSRLEQFRSDAEMSATFAALVQSRNQIRPQVAALFESFFSNVIDLDSLRTTFDKKTRTVWDQFGIKGLSGAMFLNKLVKHSSNKVEMAAILRKVLKVPATEVDGIEQMKALWNSLMKEIRDGKATTNQFQPARMSFFLSSIWHLQDTENWPPFYVSAREAFQKRGILPPVKNPVADYVAFRQIFLALANAIGATSWELERICVSPKQPSASPEIPTKAISPPAGNGKDSADGDEEDDEIAESEHSRIQWILATLGKDIGCKIWIAANDHNRTWNGKRLGDLSIPTLPNLGMGTASQKVVNLIDVLWIKGANQVVAAFEVEHSTSVYSGLLRMSDLTVMAPNILFPIYIVAPEERLSKVVKELSRPTFQTLELHKRCGYFSCESLVQEESAIRKWSKDPSAIEQLARRVDDVQGEQE